MESLKEIMNKYNADVTLPLFGKQLRISSKRMIYFHVKEKYEQIADEAVKTFKKAFSELKNMDELLSNMSELLILSLADGIQEAAKDAVSVNAFSMDATAIMKLCIKEGYFQAYFEACHKYIERDDEIVSRLANAKAYRASRKANRAKWTSVTYGGNMLDAWGNQFKAAQMNAIEGMGHSVINAIGNLWDESTVDEQRASLFRNASYKQEMIDSIRTCAFKLRLVFTKKLNQSFSLGLGGWVSSSDSQKAESIFNNLKTIQMDEAQRLECGLKVIELDPFNAQYLKEFCKIFPNYLDDIAKVAKTFKMNSILLEMLKQYVSSCSMATEEEVQKYKATVKEKANSFGISEKKIAPLLQPLDKKLEEFDVAYRTVNGVLLKTRTEADQANKDIASNQDILQQDYSQFHYKFEFLEHQKKLEALAINSDLKTKYLEECKKAIKQFDSECEDASRWQWRLDHHNNKFYNGDAMGMIIFYSLTAFFIYKMIIAYVEHGSIISRIIWTVLVFLFIVGFWGMISSEKENWEKRTQNGQLKLSDIMSETPLPAFSEQQISANQEPQSEDDNPSSGTAD